jgi:FkbM family methyltransferase
LSVESWLAKAKSCWPWQKHRAKKLSHYNALLRLQAHGYCPTTIYDIGAYRAGWSSIAKRVFPGANLILFEANADNLPYLEASGHRYLGVTLADVDAEKTFFLPHTGDVTGASLYLENTSHYAASNVVERKVSCARLDTIVRENGLPRADLIKIDVQGAEIDVIAGATETLAGCDVLIAELSLVRYNHDAPLMDDVIAAIVRQGLRCVDICELHRTDLGSVLQADFLFVKPALFDRYSVRVDLV